MVPSWPSRFWNWSRSRMNTKAQHISVDGLDVEVVRKDIKNLHLGVYPPNGRVRIAVPLRVSDSDVRLVVISKLEWIKRKRAGFAFQKRESPREMVSGESHYYLGRRFRLRVIAHTGTTKVLLRDGASLELHARPDSTPLQRDQALQRWYRCQLRLLVPPLIEKWQPVLGVKVAQWGIKQMKTRWGTCNFNARRIWLNLELAKKPASCLEYVLVHEMAHFLEPNHSDRFKDLMSRLMPQWSLHREELNHSPLAHEGWPD